MENSMLMQADMKTREIWVDNVKVVACILVVLGHFFQSMVKAGILPDSLSYQWFNTTIYYFHVPLFFICSGYLYQKYSRGCTFKMWAHNISKKALALGAPYFTFTFITLLLKKLGGNAVNEVGGGGILYTLFLHPVSPYWFLYVLFFIFLITPTCKTSRQMWDLTIFALIFKLITIFSLLSVPIPYAVSGILQNEIWFVIGMNMAWFKWYEKIDVSMTILLGIAFLVLSVFRISTPGPAFLLGIMACMSVIGIIHISFKSNHQKSPWGLMALYTMPIYVMHTIFAAGFRIVLLKIGICSPLIHVIAGIIISFAGPIIAAFIMKRTKYLGIFLYPTKLIKI